MAENNIRPQPWFQEKFLSSSADVLVGWSAAWVWKTFALLMEATRHLHVPKFGVRGFRRISTQITNQGWMWDKSLEIFPAMGGIPRHHELDWSFPAWTKAKFSHLEHEKDVMGHQWAEYPLILFDELTHFTRKQFLYLLSRNRSVSGVRPYVRTTCNPDPFSWVLYLVEWWIDPTTGLPIREREGVLRYFAVQEENFIFWDSPKEVVSQAPHIFQPIIDRGIDINEIVKSLTFISGSIYDNKKLLEKDPSYLGNLLAQSESDRLSLLEGSWLLREDQLDIFNVSALRDINSNFIPEENEYYITCDAARLGRDLMVVKVWKWWRVEEIHILSKSRTYEITELIESIRARKKIPKSRVLVDQDGLGGGVLDDSVEWNSIYCGFSGGTWSLEDPKTKVKEAYDNLKTQCAYRMAERVNSRAVSTKGVVITVDRVETNLITIWKNTYNVLTLLGEDLRSMKKVQDSPSGKKRMTPKEDQKVGLRRSPDLGDAFIMREWFELQPKRINTTVTIA